MSAPSDLPAEGPGDREVGRPLVGVSRCLLGDAVRYDGGHKLDRFLAEVLGRQEAYGCGLPAVSLR